MDVVHLINEFEFLIDKLNENFQLFVFHRHLALDMACIEGGANGIIVDLETVGKSERQSGVDTEINDHSVQDLMQIKKKSAAYVICRINALNQDSQKEIDQVIEAGADEILVPMIKQNNEVKEIFRLVKERKPIGLMIETKEAIAIANQLDQYPLARAYVGLNDLCISRKSNSIFAAIADGTLDKIRGQIVKAPFGFAGLTIPDKGHPLPALHLINELIRLDCQFTFLRRSFFHDTLNKNVQIEIPRIQNSIRKSKQRTSSQIKKDKISLEKKLETLMRGSHE